MELQYFWEEGEKMTVFIFNIKRVFNRKRDILTVYIIPIIISLIVGQINFELPKLKIAVLNYDNTYLANKFIKDLSDSYEIESVDRTQINDKISNQEIDYAIIIDKGFSKSIINGQMPNMKVFYNSESDLHKLVDANISAFIQKSSSMALKYNKNSKMFYDKLDLFISENKVKYFEVESSSKQYIMLTLNFLVMLMLYCAINMTAKVINNKKEIIRTFAAPITIKSYMLQTILTLFLLELVQVIIIFIVLIIQYKLVIISYLWKLLLLYSVYSTTAISLALFMNYITKKYVKRDFISHILVVPICMLGGCFWNINMVPKGFQFIAQFVPTTWIVNGTYGVLKDKSYTVWGTDLGILLLFSVVFLMLGVFTKKDIVN